MILSILLTGNLDLYQVIKVNVDCDEFKDELNRKIVQKLYEEFEKGNSNINAILDNLDDSEQSHITAIMADDYEIDDMEKAIDDITIFSSELEENGITYLERVEFTLQIRDNDTYEMISDTAPIQISTQ